MKRNIITSLILISVLLGLVYYVYNKAEEEASLKKTNLSFIPATNTFLIVDVKNISEQIQQVFSSNLIWTDLSTKDSLFEKIETNINLYDSLFDQKNIKLINTSVAFLTGDSSNIDFLLVSELKNSLSIDSLSDENRTTNKEIFKFELSQSTLYATYLNDRLICSNNSELLKFNFLKTIENDSIFNRVYETRAQKNTNLFLYANINKINKLFNLKLEGYIEKSTWSAFDLKLSQDVISGNGFVLNTSLNGISKNYSENFFNITPSSINQLSVTNFNNIDELNINNDIISKNNEYCNCDFLTDGLGWIEKQIIHVATTFNSAEFLAFKLIDMNSFNIALNQFTDSITKEYRVDSSFYIKSFKSNIDLGGVFGKKMELNYYTLYNDYVIFGSSIDELKHLLYELNDNRKLKQNEKLYAFYLENSSENSFFKKIQKGFLLNTNLGDDGVSIIESSVKEKNLVYTNFSYSKGINIGGSYHDAKWEMFFENPIVKSIYFVSNHKTNDKDILIQDTTNTIYLVSTSGNIKWKRKIAGKIIDNITKVDIYNNGKYQMLFNTNSHLYLIDVLGRDVESFPKKLNGATNAVSIIDYNKDGDYRFLVSTANGILNFNKEGQQISGWKDPKTKVKVTTPIKHLLANTKDYLFANDVNGNVYLYSRRGEIRHAVSSKFIGRFFPIDMGNTIEESRGIYWDRSRNELRKQFFNNEISTILTLPDSVIKFHYLNFYNDNKEKNYILETKSELYIYDKGGNVIEVFQLSPEHKKLSISKNYIAYINKVTHDFILLNKKGNELLRSSNVSYFNIDDSFSKTRVLLLNNNKLQMILPK